MLKLFHILLDFAKKKKKVSVSHIYLKKKKKGLFGLKVWLHLNTVQS